jgi:hypothetical protein
MLHRNGFRSSKRLVEAKRCGEGMPKILFTEMRLIKSLSWPKTLTVHHESVHATS